MSLLKKLFGRDDSNNTSPADSRNGGDSRELPAGHEQFVVCKYCQRKVKKRVRHQCQPMRERRVAARRASEDDDDFFVSFLVAYSTNDWGWGYVGGGNLMGAILGEALRDDGYEEDISSNLVQEAGPDAFLDPQPEHAEEPPVIAVDPDGVDGGVSAETFGESAGPDLDADDTAGESADTY